MRPEIEYKDWKVWGSVSQLRHNCFRVKTPYYTCVKTLKGEAKIHCTACGEQLPDDVKEYFWRMHRLLNMSGI